MLACPLWTKLQLRHEVCHFLYYVKLKGLWILPGGNSVFSIFKILPHFQDIIASIVKLYEKAGLRQRNKIMRQMRSLTLLNVSYITTLFNNNLFNIKIRKDDVDICYVGTLFAWKFHWMNELVHIYVNLIWIQ